MPQPCLPANGWEEDTKPAPSPVASPSCSGAAAEPVWERNLQVAPRCVTRPCITDNEERSGRSKNLSKVEIKRIGCGVKDELWAVAKCWLAPGALRVSNPLCDGFGRADSAWG